MIGDGAAGAVPFAFVDADHAAGLAGDAAVGEEIGRIGEDEVHGGSAESSGTHKARFGDGGEDFDAVALIDFDVVLGVVEDGSGQRRRAQDNLLRAGRGLGHASSVLEEAKRGPSSLRSSG